MRLEIASPKAVKYAIKNWHYSKTVPMVQLAYAVFNSKNEWCGVICYGQGISIHAAKPFGMKNGEVCELVRVALNGKQESTSKAVSISLKLIKKHCPLLQLIISYADSEQGHIGTIYQASNWYFIGSKKTTPKYVFNGKIVHSRNVSTTGVVKSFGQKTRTGYKQKNADSIIDGSIKHKYVYPLTKNAKLVCEKLKLEYPKKHAALAHKGEQGITNTNGAFDSTMPLN